MLPCALLVKIQIGEDLIMEASPRSLPRGGSSPRPLSQFQQQNAGRTSAARAGDRFGYSKR